MLGLVRTLDGKTDIVGLVLAQCGEFDTKLTDVSPSDLFIKLLGQHATMLVSSKV